MLLALLFSIVAPISVSFSALICLVAVPFGVVSMQYCLRVGVIM